MDVKKIVAEMTLEEKASLLSGQDFWRTKAVERLGIPQIMMSDGPHGLRKQDVGGDHLGVNDSIKAVCFPAASATAASFDPKLVQQIGEAVGDSCQHEKLAVVLGPAVNIKRSPLCGRNFEYFSEDPYLAGEMAVGMIRGIQSRDVGTSIKHFAANNQEHRRMSSDSVVDERTLREIYFPAFETAIKEAKPWTVMCSYNRVNGEYASQNRWLLTDVLRDQWGFDGLVVSDWGAVSDRVKGVHAGMDLEMPSSGGANDARIVAAVRNGELDEKDVDLAAEHVLTLIDKYVSNARPDTVWDKDAQHNLARRTAAECIVLLKNDDHVLPLSRDEKIAVIGEFARTPRYQGGGSSHINSFQVESLMDALVDNPNITYAQGYSVKRDEPDESLIASAVEAARNADKAVIVAGLPDSYESEGYDRKHMRMPENQIQLIMRVSAVNRNTVVVLYNGSPVEMPWIGRVRGVLEAYLGGQAVGGATKAVLFGDVNPCGRLPETFPYHMEDNPSFLSYGGEGNTAVYSEGIFVGYRYYDRKKMDVLFPFGFGMSYTTFSYSNMRVDKDEITDEETVTVSVDVTNTGDRAGKEVVQLYVRDLESSVFRPIRELKGFEKIYLQSGETKTVSFTLNKRSFAFWDIRIHDWNVETGVFRIEIARSSRDVQAGCDIMVKGTVDVEEPLTVDTIFMDIDKSPKAKKAVEPILNKIQSAFTGGASEQASEAITEEMSNAMMAYMPLRGVVSFTEGAITFDEVQKIVKEI